MPKVHTKTNDRSTEIDTGFWVVVGADSHTEACAERLRDACLHALDRGAQNLAVDVSATRTLSAALIDVLVSASDVVRARGGSLVLWACRNEFGDPIVLIVSGDGKEAAIAQLRATNRGGVQ